MNSLLARTLLIVALLIPAPLIAQQATSAPEATSYELNAQETASAVRLATQAIEQRKLRAKGPLYLVATELIRDKDAKGELAPARLALVTHYRYEGDVAIVSLVDVTAGKVVQTEAIAHRPVPLAPEEFERARKLGLGDAAVQQALGSARDKVVVEALQLRTADEKDPIFGHRVVRLLFKVETDYLTAPIVIVDLTTGKVTIEQPPSMTEHEGEQP